MYITKLQLQLAIVNKVMADSQTGHSELFMTGEIKYMPYYKYI